MPGTEIAPLTGRMIIVGEPAGAVGAATGVATGLGVGGGVVLGFVPTHFSIARSRGSE